ncbi:hypothetical protein VPH35_041814 [Triticum aestivum]
MILRNWDGSVIFSAHRHLFHCNDALEAELHAIMEGMALSVEHTTLPVVVQSDSTTALSILTSNELDRSAYGHLILETKDLMVGREFIPMKISRDQNRVADYLANYDRTNHSTACWLRRGHPCIAELLSADCNSTFLE